MAPKDTHIFTFPFNLFGILLYLFGAKVAIEVNKEAKRRGETSGPPKRLYLDGYYRYTRNPMYLATGIALFGVAIVLPSYYNFIFPIIYVVIIDRFYIMIEEQNMRKEYDKEFTAYENQVGKWMGRKYSF